MVISHFINAKILIQDLTPHFTPIFIKYYTGLAYQLRWSLTDTWEQY